MRASSPMPGVVWLNYATKRAAAEAMVRIQEHYESPYPSIRGQHVDLDAFKALYAADHCGKFTYAEDWSGYNVPGEVVERFFEMHEDLTGEEQDVANAITFLVPPGERFYLIATCREDPEFEHEMAHALWYLRPGYADAARALLLLDPVLPLVEWLGREGYDVSVLEDECHAYLATSPREWFVEEFGEARLYYPAERHRRLYQGAVHGG
jgi:hypothetical protein